MRVHRQGDVLGGRAHFDGQHALGNEFAGARADDANAEDAFGIRIDDELGQAVGAVEGQARPEAAHGNLATLTSMPFALASCFGQPAPGQFRIGEHDGGMVISVKALSSPTMTSTAMRASLEALWASNTPPAMSPMA
jgi:hypothetical protein